MTDLAHLRFADDVFPVVEALQRVRPIAAMPASDYYEGAPDGWYVITMRIEHPRDMLEVIAQVTRGTAIDGELLSCDVRSDDSGIYATFFNLRGLRQAVH